MKKFLKKNMAYVIIAALLMLFIGCILLFGAGGKKTEASKNVTQWLKDTASDKYVVTVLAQTTCNHCQAFKPFMEEIKEKYGINLYWFEMDVLNKTNVVDYETIENTYELEKYTGTPYTFVTKNGKVIKYLSGRTENVEALEDFLNQAGVIGID